jgi:hypothetical protein
MENKNEVNLDEETIRKAGLRPSATTINATIAPGTRVFEYPGLEQVYVMESDLYGNVMPKGSCFLAFQGRNGLMGQHIKVETLKSCSVEEIKKLIDSNAAG